MHETGVDCQAYRKRIQCKLTQPMEKSCHRILVQPLCGWLLLYIWVWSLLYISGTMAYCHSPPGCQAGAPPPGHPFWGHTHLGGCRGVKLAGEEHAGAVDEEGGVVRHQVLGLRAAELPLGPGLDKRCRRPPTAAAVKSRQNPKP